jgi:lipopolysaccharide transport system ATP-binding protein
MQGDAFRVVKAYEEYLHGPIEGLRGKKENKPGSAQPQRRDLPGEVRGLNNRRSDARFQDPPFVPHAHPAVLPEPDRVDAEQLLHHAAGGVSRWQSEPGLKVTGFLVVSSKGIGNKIVSLQPSRFIVSLTAERDGEYHCRYGIAIHDLMGQCLTRIFSPDDEFSIAAGEVRRVRLTLNPVQLGPGEYTVGISVLENGPLEKLNSSRRYDLLSRSFALSVELPESLGALSSAFFHTGEWTFGEDSDQP